MRFIFGIWTMIVALAVSAVAAYYSIIGLTAIFAAAVIPIIIMGVALEVAKITTAIWLHSFWHEAGFLMKTYLTSAVVILMLITSMGIFGFLSKAHIEQSASSGSLVAQIERIDQEVLREQQTIERANLAISGFGESVTEADTGIQGRIEAQERIISDISARLDRDIAAQNQIISQSNRLVQPLQDELERIEKRREELRAAQTANNVEALQALVGARVDGRIGPDTQRRIAEFEANLDAQRAQLLERLQAAQQVDDPAAVAARAEITRLQQAANAEIARAQEAINSFRQQLIAVTTKDNTEAINAQNALISDANLRIDELLQRKFDLEAELRVLEVEVGPVKYIAELIYGETNPDLLEEAVRWVILILVLVFDPLAIVLVLAGISLLHRREEPIDKKVETPHNDNNDGPQEETAPSDVTVATTEATKDQAPETPTVDDTVVEEDLLKKEGSFLRVRRISSQNGSTNDH